MKVKPMNQETEQDYFTKGQLMDLFGKNAAGINHAIKKLGIKPFEPGHYSAFKGMLIKKKDVIQMATYYGLIRIYVLYPEQVEKIATKSKNNKNLYIKAGKVLKLHSSYWVDPRNLKSLSNRNVPAE